MRRIRLLVSLAVAAVVMCSIAVSSASASFSFAFTTDNQGWRSSNGNGATPGPADWSATGGNPGGQINVSDTFNGNGSVFVSPAGGLGDHSSNVGGTLSVDAKYTTLNVAWSNGFFIELENPTSALCVVSNTDLTGSFHTFSFTLDSADVGVIDTNTGICSGSATSAQIAGVLSDLRLVIQGESGANTGQTVTIDNVSLSGGAPIPKHTLTVAKAGSGAGTVTSSAGGISCGATCSTQVFTGSVVTLTASPAAGSSFSGWSGGGCSGAATTCQVTVNADTAVTASFTSTPPPAKNTLTVIKTGAGSGTVTSAPGGINCGATCSATFTAGSTVTLAAQAGAGSKFAGWNGACTGTGSCTVKMNAAASVAATFNRVVSRPPRPNTSITNSTIDTGAGNASFRFKASGKATGFQCALVKKHKKARFANCKSPKKYRKLKAGSYTFEVRAVGPGGPDLSPAKFGFRIK